MDQVNTLDANITYVQDNINECQSNIMGMEETKDEGQEPTALIEHVTFEESKYLLEHLINYIIHKVSNSLSICKFTSVTSQFPL